MITYVRHVRSALTPEEAAEVALVDGIAARLRSAMGDRRHELALAHIHGAPSSAIQSLISEILRAELAFDEEVVLRPEDQFVTQARPDFFYDLGGNRGILAEVERGGTTTNNHDLKDLWKAHLAPNAHHLFLIVPQSNWKPDGSAREKPFPIVARRLGSFFGNPRREIDVVSLHVYGY